MPTYLLLSRKKPLLKLEPVSSCPSGTELCEKTPRLKRVRVVSPDVKTQWDVQVGTSFAKAVQQGHAALDPARRPPVATRARLRVTAVEVDLAAASDIAATSPL